MSGGSSYGPPSRGGGGEYDRRGYDAGPPPSTQDSYSQYSGSRDGGAYNSGPTSSGYSQGGSRYPSNPLPLSGVTVQEKYTQVSFEKTVVGSILCRHEDPSNRGTSMYVELVELYI